MRHGEKGGRSAEPGHNIVDSAGAHIELTQNALGDHEHADQHNEKRAQGP